MPRKDPKAFKSLITSKRLKITRYLIAPDGTSITCSRCGRTSYNLNDVREPVLWILSRLS